MIRLAHADDIEAIHAVELSAGELFVGTHMAWAVGETTDRAVLLGAIARGDLWVAVAQGAVIGFLIAEVLDGDFAIDEVAVSRSHHRQGVGRLLIESALAVARQRGHRQVVLTTDRELSWNAPYYQRLGFRVLDPGEIPPELAARLSSLPAPERRCAMVRLVIPPATANGGGA